MMYGDKKSKKIKKGKKMEPNMTNSAMGNTMPMGKDSYHHLSSGKRTRRSAM